MNNRLDLTLDGFSDMEDHGTKEDGTPDIRVVRGYRIRLVENHARILFEATLLRDDLPVEPTDLLASRVASILTKYLPLIDPR